MKSKKILAIILASIMAVAMLSGCTKKPDDSSSTPDSSSPPPSSAPAKAESGQLASVREALKTAYGEVYEENTMEMDATTIEQMYGVKADLYKDSFIDVAMINTRVDSVLGFEAAEGKVKDLETAMNAYRDKVIADKEAFPYLPDHLPKAKASKVVTVDDYVFFVMIADTAEAAEDNMEQMITDGIQKGVDAINNTLKP